MSSARLTRNAMRLIPRAMEGDMLAVAMLAVMGIVIVKDMIAEQKKH